MSTSPPSNRCPRCGDPLSRDRSAGGLCPKCLLGLGLSPGAAGGEFFVTGAAEVEPPPSPEELAPFFPQYEIVELVGRGGMGAVYRALQRGLERSVAIKILASDTAQDPTFAERFTREGRALAKLSHANIVSIYDSGRSGELYYFVMEYVEGANLRSLIRAKSATPRQSLSIVSQICDALQYAHEEGVVHRDIKPENILVDKRGRVKIADFGLAKLLGGTATDVALTRTQQSMGTPHYMAPEQWEHPDTADHRVDIYALGVVLYELLTGELPLGRFSLPSQKLQLDVRLDDVVVRTLAKEPALRYQSASAIKVDVDKLANAPQPEPPRKRGCIGAFVHKVVHTFDPREHVRKSLFGMPLTSNWVPIAAVSFLWLVVAIDPQICFFWGAASVGTIAIIWNTR